MFPTHPQDALRIIHNNYPEPRHFVAEDSAGSRPARLTVAKVLQGFRRHRAR